MVSLPVPASRCKYCTAAAGMYHPTTHGLPPWPTRAALLELPSVVRAVHFKRLQANRERRPATIIAIVRDPSCPGRLHHVLPGNNVVAAGVCLAQAGPALPPENRPPRLHSSDETTWSVVQSKARRHLDPGIGLRHNGQSVYVPLKRRLTGDGPCACACAKHSAQAKPPRQPTGTVWL